jgi:hypothetical protein
MDRIQNLGMPRDRQQRLTLKRVDNDQRRFGIANARRLIYELNYAVDSKSLAGFSQCRILGSHAGEYSNALMAEHGLIFITECFFQEAPALGFNLFEMLVVDLMHEFELGVWKALFIHLLRILRSVNASLLHELDHRYLSCSLYCLLLITACRFRQIPTFGRDTIRKVSI